MSNNLLTMARQAMGEAMAQKLAPVLESPSDALNAWPRPPCCLPCWPVLPGAATASMVQVPCSALPTSRASTASCSPRLPALLDEPKDQLLNLAELGKSLLLALFGEKTMALTHELAGLSALPTESAGRLMGIVAALLFSMVKAEARRLDLGAADLQSLLASQQSDLMAQVDPRLSAALELHAVNARPAQSPAASKQGARADCCSQASGGAADARQAECSLGFLVAAMADLGAGNDGYFVGRVCLAGPCRQRA